MTRRGLVGACLLAAVGSVPAAAQQAALVAPSPFVRTPAIPLAGADSLFVRFSVRTDTVVRVAGGTTIVPRGCGFSMFFVRVWRRHGKDSTVVLADSVELQSRIVSLSVPSDTTVAPSLARTCLP